MDNVQAIAETANNTNERNYGIDILRMVCMIMIPILHILGHGGILQATQPLTFEHYAYWFLEILCYGAVNLFGMISGYVAYGHKTKYSNLVLLWLRVFLYSVIISVVFYVFKLEPFSWKSLVKSVFPTIFNRWWYWTAYVGLMLLSPIINKGIEVLSKKTSIIAMIALLIIFSAITTISIQHDAFSLNGGYSVV